MFSGCAFADHSLFFFLLITGQKESDEEDYDSDLEEDHMKMDKKAQHSHGDADVSDMSDLVEEEEVNFDEEADVARKVLNNFLSSSNGSVAPVNDDSKSVQRIQDDETVKAHNKADGHTNLIKPETLAKAENTNFKSAETEEELERTLFISNLPFDITNEEVKQRFTGFGEIQSFFPVLHPITK